MIAQLVYTTGNVECELFSFEGASQNLVVSDGLMLRNMVLNTVKSKN